MDDQGLAHRAILLLTLGEELAAEVFKHLSPKEVHRIGEAMTRIRTVPRERVNAVLDRFMHEAGSNRSLVADNDEYVKSVLRKALGEDRAGLLINRILQGSDTSVEVPQAVVPVKETRSSRRASIGVVGRA